MKHPFDKSLRRERAAFRHMTAARTRYEAARAEWQRIAERIHIENSAILDGWHKALGTQREKGNDATSKN